VLLTAPSVTGGTTVGDTLSCGSGSWSANPPPSFAPGWIGPGSDGNMWFTEYKGEKIGRIAPGGAVSEFGVPAETARPEGIALGPDGSMWFTERHANKIGRITTDGAIKMLDHSGGVEKLVLVLTSPVRRDDGERLIVSHLVFPRFGRVSGQITDSENQGQIRHRRMVSGQCDGSRMRALGPARLFTCAASIR
jgi:hypothetical protein